MDSIQFTPHGLARVKQELEGLIKERPQAVAYLQKARALGDLSENGFYKSSKTKLSSIDSRIRRLQDILNNAVAVQNTNKNVIGIGNTVVLNDGKEQVTYTIVGDLEADPLNKKISLLSPLGKVLNGRKVGDHVILITPSLKISYEIVRVDLFY